MKFYGKAESVAKTIIEAFKTKNLPEVLSNIFITTGGRHCDTYSYRNRFLLLLSGIMGDAMGYGSDKHSSGWTSVGRQVRKGEKATYILAPCTCKVDDPKAESGKRTIVSGFRGVAVFGIEQTDIVDQELWAKQNKDNEKADKFLSQLPLREVADAWGIKLQAYKGQKARGAGWYSRTANAIGLGVENLSTWAHELVHAADDRKGNMIETGQHFRSEIVAELGGSILMYTLGYKKDADLGGAYKYIERYATAAKIEPIKACMDVINRTCEAVALILEESDNILSLNNYSDKDTSLENKDEATKSDKPVTQTVAA